MKKRCFVIQPFDDDKYDKRFESIYEPALNNAGLEAYRVDRDLGVVVVIDAIEDGIREADICFADITESNENVWYELGFAYAQAKAVVLVSSKERKEFPFDIRHRQIIRYSSEVSSDHDDLNRKITEKAQAYLKSTQAVDNIQQSHQSVQIDGLSQIELYILAEVASSNIDSTKPALDTLRHRVIRRNSWTKIGFTMALRKLVESEYIKIENIRSTDPYSYAEYAYKGVLLTTKAWKLLDEHSDLFVI